MTEKKLILIVEDDHQIRELVKINLEEIGYQVIETSTAAQAAVEVRSFDLDLIILDLGLPDRNGVNFIRECRLLSTVPILVLSARIQEISKVSALDAGADDYITKPFGISELLARVRALLRRAPISFDSADSVQKNPAMEFGRFRLDFINRVLSSNEEIIKLTDIQYRLLVLLASNPNRVMTHRQLLMQIWGERSLDNHQYLRVYVGHLRQKIEENPADPCHILTEVGVGYRFQL